MDNIAILPRHSIGISSGTPWTLSPVVSGTSFRFEIRAPFPDYDIQSQLGKTFPVCKVQSASDAEAIVNAVNNHETLITHLDACRLFLERALRGESSIQEAADTIRHLETVIAKAGGNQ